MRIIDGVSPRKNRDLSAELSKIQELSSQDAIIMVGFDELASLAPHFGPILGWDIEEFPEG